jgi:hypothetical protein
MRIEIKAIEPGAIRYSTCGDWQWLPDGSLVVSVPDYGGQNDSAFLVALHEMVEAWLCRRDNISEKDVSIWDMCNPDLDEPGDDPNAPYFRQHKVAMDIEKKVCNAMHKDWREHEMWVQNAAAEVDRQHEREMPAITKQGPRFWAELHLFALRHMGEDSSEWFGAWIDDLPFGECPCAKHLHEYLKENPPDWEDFFLWTVDLHNAVNDRIGKPTISVDDAAELWQNRTF